MTFRLQWKCRKSRRHIGNHMKIMREEIMKIIEMAGSDIENACQIIAESWKTAYCGIVPQDYLDALGPERWLPKLKDFGTVFLLEDAGIPVATTAVSATREEKMTGWGEVILLYVRPDAFRRGYGTMLLRHAVNELRRKGLHKIFLWVFEENQAARAFYERNGFHGNGDRIVINIGGKDLTELRYVYEDPEGFNSTKRLSEMSNEELWQLFPIILCEHRECWSKWYEQEAAFLRGVLPEESIVRISHVGSTSVPDIFAKPIVDLLVEFEPATDMDLIKGLLLKNGYRIMSEEPRRISLNKGYTEQGFAEKVFHLHARFSGDNNELYFRDYLRDHPEVAAEYEKLKLELRDRYEHDRDAYTEAKGDFIGKYTSIAKCEYGARYD